MAGRDKRRLVDYRTIKQELLRSGSHFNDPDFPPDASSLYIHDQISSRVGHVVWKRPKDLCSNPRFVVRGACRHDLGQGRLGNCWFIAGAATLATGHKKLLERVVPLDQEFDQTYAGIFHFHFWWNGEWEEVVVDDYLPTNGRQLIYCQNREEPNEFWPALLEKAYAKLRGCYQKLDGGKLQDAMVDLTGGISEVIDLRDKGSLPPNLYDLLLNSYSMTSLLGCCIFRQEGSPESEVKMPNGLCKGHAYSITGFHQLKTNRRVIQLIRMRNPWGRGEWNGAWSDRSEEVASLPENQKRKMRIQNRDEGEFWISYKDMMQNFDQVILCHLHKEDMVKNKQNWNVKMYQEVTAGGPPNQRLYWNNPQFYIKLKNPDSVNSQGGDCTLILSLMKEEANNKSTAAIGFDVYELKHRNPRPLNEESGPSNALLRAQTSDKGREITTRVTLPPGRYVIIPFTSQPHEEAKFMLRIFTEKYADSRAMGSVKAERQGDDTPQKAGEERGRHSGCVVA